MVEPLIQPEQPAEEIKKKTKKRPKEPKSFKMMAIARSGYGKTQIILQHLRNIVEKKQVDPRRVVIFSQTALSDPKQLDFIDDMEKLTPKYDYRKNNVFTDIDYEFLEALYNGNKMLKEAGKKYKHWVLFFDDQIIDTNIKNRLSPILQKIACIGRHFGISQIWALQVYRNSMSTIMREQVSNILCGDMSSDQAKMDLLNQYSSGFNSNDPKKSAKHLLMTFQQDVLPTSDGHGFLNIHAEQTSDKKFQVGLDGAFLKNRFE